ncbi:hypothetical protein TYRP_013589 [Tyrophagus putrescentiae]|mgnify:CR=1 FL=1|nr:hypothetical protein TYRP_013589 [Tyrophagus putrescentiae]
MKLRFSTLDIIAILPEIRNKLLGTRVNQIYDVDTKTFIFRFAKTGNETSDEESLKQMLIIESGNRLHLTEFNWPKNDNPSGFTMKLRKHLRNKRLESINQIGVDRVIDMQFGINEFTCHVIVEFYSKGNIILTDKDYNILSLVRVYMDNKTNINIAVREKYPINKQVYIAGQDIISRQKIEQIIADAKDTNFKKLFNPIFPYGTSLLEHCLLHFKDTNVNKFKVTKEDIELLEKVFAYAESQVDFFRNNCTKGYIITKIEKRPNSEEQLTTYDDFQPYLFTQYINEKASFEEYESFNQAVDLFYSKIEGQKIESKVVQQEKHAMKKLDAIKRDHEARLENLSKMQEVDNEKAQLIESNIELVDGAISVLRSAIANKYSWEMISEIVRDAQDNGDLIASKIKDLKLDKNSFVMSLDDPYETETKGNSKLIEIDIGLSAYANARRFYEHRKDAAKKEQKTIDHTEKAFKNVERKVKQQLKETTIKTNIVLARKVLWFEKFFWFISSEGYLVIAGRDAQQNEVIVKRHLDKDDIYVHADIHGASSVVIKNHTDAEIPPKTLNEAANLAICFSASWEAKVVSAAYWVYSHQVQKTAPSGQYLSVGSFMIRGKKNFIPLQNLILGFGILFRIDEESIDRRQKVIKEEAVKEENWNRSPVASNEEDDDGAFPDTAIPLTRDSVSEDNTTSKAESDYTIVTTGVAVKKVKVFDQKTVKKSEKQAKQNKRAEKKKAKKGGAVKEEEVVEKPAEKPAEKPEPVEVMEPVAAQQEKESEATEASVPEGGEQEVLEEQEEDDEENEGAVADPKQRELDARKILNSLVHTPNPEDQLLYAIPVCGSYSAMNAYKYKVKIIPGNTRRGPASKTALSIFLKEKLATERERDLLKALKDTEMGRNMPGKVKILTSNLNK